MTRAPEHAVHRSDLALSGLSLSTPVLLAVEALRQAAAPPLSDPGAPVRLSDLPALWRAHLQDPPGVYGTLVPLGYERIERPDWERLLIHVGRQLEHAFRLAGLFALVERGPAPEELAEAPVLSNWAPGTAWFGDLVLAGHVAGHPHLPSTWIRTSPLLGLDPRRRWARTWSRWYRLGEPMTEAHLPEFEVAPLRVRLIETDEGEVARYLAGLRERVARRLEPLRQGRC